MYTEIPIHQLLESKEIPKREGKDDLDELVTDIAERGLLQPLLVRPFELAKDKYEVYAGRRRLEALRKLGRAVAPCRIQTGLDDLGARIDSLSENLHRRPLTQSEKFQGLQSVLSRCGTDDPEEAARKAGITKSTFRAYQRMREALEPSLCKDLDSDKIPMDVAIALTKLEKEDQRPLLEEVGPVAKEIRERTKKTPLPKEPWVYDEHGNTIVIPSFLYGKVLGIVRQSMK